jgi:hypothetical protein
MSMKASILKHSDNFPFSQFAKIMVRGEKDINK